MKPPTEGGGPVAEGEELATEAEVAATELPNAGEELGEDVPLRKKPARAQPKTQQKLESEDDVDAAERDDEESDEVQELGAESDVEPGDEGGQSGDEEGLSDEPEASSESVEELADEGQASRRKLSMAWRTRRLPTNPSGSSASDRRHRTRMCPTKKSRGAAVSRAGGARFS